MSAHRMAARISTLGVAALALTVLTIDPADGRGPGCGWDQGRDSGAHPVAACGTQGIHGRAQDRPAFEDR